MAKKLNSFILFSGLYEIVQLFSIGIQDIMFPNKHQHLHNHFLFSKILQTFEIDQRNSLIRIF
jgi:hypothetical protein